MKVLFVANRAEYGGAPKCMLELIDQLIQNYGVEVEVITSIESEIARWCDARNIKHYAVGHTSFAIGKGSTPIRRFAKTLLTPYYLVKSYTLNHKAFKRACDQIDFSGIDIIHTNSNRDCLGAMLAKRYNIPHIWHLREFGREDYDIRYLMLNHIGFMNSTTDYFVAISDAVKKAWVRKGIKEEKIFRIYDGIKLPSKEIVQRASLFQAREPLDTLQVAYLGIVCPAKGQFDAVKALTYLDLKIAKKIKIDFWGDCDSLPEFTNQIRQYAKAHGYEHSVSFRGFTNNIWDELPHYDAAMVCSRSEAFGRITPEYMSVGLQVIASDTGSNPELIEDEKSGLIYDHSDLKDLAKKIENVYFMTFAERKKMSDAAIDRAAVFSDINHAKNMYDFYRSIVG